MENYHTYYIEVKEGHARVALKDYLVSQGFAVNLLRKIKHEGKVWVNGQERPLFDKVKTGDKLVIDFGQETIEPEPENIPLNIIYEDLDLLVVNKDPFLVAHPVRRYPQGTLANGLAYYYQEKEIKAKVRFINRLDRNTSGIIMVSKNIYAHEFLQKQLKERSFYKAYWALVEGSLKNQEGIINAPIARVKPIAINRAVIDGGQEAITRYQVLKKFTNMSLVKLIPVTGRTHQLRVHMAYLGHPIIGDDLYNPCTNQILNRQALHAREIGFIHPRTKEYIIVKAPLSSDIAKLIKEKE
ncbi:MAG: RluA family pseudouridine synthase [Peptococcales bacterium]|jgi:23S rRNA pseudouridine1911/1915/1917 synthase